MAEVASAFVSLVPSARGFGSSASRQIGPQMDGVAKTSGSRFGRIFATSTMGPLRALGGAALGFFAVTKIKAFFGSAIDEAREAQKVSALTEQVIKSTGGAAQISAKQVGNLATSISNKVGIDDEAIQSGLNLLLTFKGVRNEAGAGNKIFNQASHSIVDMASAMAAASGGQVDFKSATTLVGKALNDPIKGLSALSRVGVTFTDGQKKTIESLVKQGKTMKAQKLILKELNSEFGGAAAAQVTPADKARVAWGNLKEQIGTLLLPVIDKVATIFSSKVVPAISTFVSQMKSGQGAGGQFVSIMSQIAAVLKTVFGFVNNNRTVVATFVGVIVAWTVAQAALNIVLAANPLGLIIVAIAALAAGFVYAYQNSETFRNVIDSVFSFLKTAVSAVISFVSAHWQLIVSIIGGPLVAIGILVVRHWDAIKSFVMGAVNAVIGFVRDHWRLIVSIVGGPIAAAVLLVIKHWNTIKSATSAVWNAIKSVISAQINAAKAVVSAVIGAMRSNFNLLGDIVGKVREWFGNIVSAIKDKMGEAVSFVKTIPGKIKSAIGDLGSILLNAGAELIGGLIDGIKSKIGEVQSTLTGLTGKLTSWKGPPEKDKTLLTPAGKAIIQGLIDGLVSGEPGVMANLKGLTTAMEKGVVDGLTSLRDKTKTVLDGLKSDFTSLRDSISSAFTGNLFEKTDRFAFMGNLQSTIGNLGALKVAFRQLRKWGVDPGFLSQLFASGNSALILDLASGTRNEASQSASLFGQANSLANSLGAGVAMNDIGPELRSQTALLRDIEKGIRSLPKNFGKEINKPAVAGKTGRAA